MDYCGYFPTVKKFEASVNNWLLPTDAKPIIESKTLSTRCWNYPDENPKSGERMATICVYAQNNYRSYLMVELKESLVVGKTYDTEIWIKVARRSNYLCNSIGMYFSDFVVREAIIFNLPYSPQINHVEVAMDTSKWVCLRRSFKAASRAKFLIIGNFASKENTVIREIGKGSEVSKNIFCHIDDVYVGAAKD